MMDPALAPLTTVALDTEGRRLAEQACADLAAFGAEEWLERHAWWADYGKVDDPADAAIVTGIGRMRGTIGWVDWSGEDDENQVQDMVTKACAALGLADPAFPEGFSDRVFQDLDSPRPGDYVPALLRAVDDHLSTVGLRLLLIDEDSDEYEFVPVIAAAYGGLVGHAGDGFDLRGIDRVR